MSWVLPLPALCAPAHHVLSFLDFQQRTGTPQFCNGVWHLLVRWCQGLSVRFLCGWDAFSALTQTATPRFHTHPPPPKKKHIQKELLTTARAAVCDSPTAASVCR